MSRCGGLARGGLPLLQDQRRGRRPSGWYYYYYYWYYWYYWYYYYYGPSGIPCGISEGCRRTDCSSSAASSENHLIREERPRHAWHALGPPAAASALPVSIADISDNLFPGGLGGPGALVVWAVATGFQGYGPR